MNPKDYVYDIESYSNFFSCVVRHRLSRNRWVFEVSDRRSHAPQFFDFIKALEYHRCRMIGFNNDAYDYQVIHHLMKCGPNFTAADAYAMSKYLIESDNPQRAWPSDYLVDQIDLYKVHHFDNRAKSTGLKVLEFNMRSSSIGDLPFDPHAGIDTSEKMDKVLAYNAHDVDETERFADFTAEKIRFREELTDKTGVNMLNFNDTKIGKKFFEMRLEERLPGITGTYQNPRRTERPVIYPREIIFPYIEFESAELGNVLNELRATEIVNTKSALGLSATLNGFRFDFGTGGIHGSVERRHVRPQPGQTLLDVDVTSYYPTLAIANRVYPEHLTEIFCDIYEELFNERKKYPKKSAESEMLKLALNGVYGDSNNVYSRCFYDPKYTMAITINGQLLLALLAEKFLLHTNSELIQVNTDGVTVLVNDVERPMVDQIMKWWENLTRLTLEHVEYAAMWVRDVNNYIAQTKEGKLKRIGAYAYETARENGATREVQWHKDHSSLVVQKAAEAAMVRGVPVRDFIYQHTDPFDFFLRAKVSRGSSLQLTDGRPLQRVTRYIIAREGPEMVKVMPPLRGKTEPRQIAINKGWPVAICDDVRDFDPSRLNYDWYCQEAEKLVIR